MSDFETDDFEMYWDPDGLGVSVRDYEGSAFALLTRDESRWLLGWLQANQHEDNHEYKLGDKGLTTRGIAYEIVATDPVRVHMGGNDMQLEGMKIELLPPTGNVADGD
ncbi:MAG: hypothetical protein JKY52_00210 [Flavobacteriales bacterium]|nr:hypothetical protein [Flavobacteriales bacterium]